MRITPDTNVLVRAAVGDDPEQQRLAVAILKGAELVAITVPALCELVWVLRRGYKTTIPDTIAALHDLIEAAGVQTDRPVVEAGIAALADGCDFADGCIAFDGRRLGGAVFASFDRRAVSRVRSSGAEARLLGDLDP